MKRDTRMTKSAKKVLTAVKSAVKKTPTISRKVATLSKQVAKLNKISYEKHALVINGDTATSVTAPFYSFHINRRMDLWNPVFGSAIDEVSITNKMYLNSIKIDCRLSQETEADRIFYSMFIVSLKDQGADSSTFDPATGALFMTDGVQYVSLGQNGRVLVNPNFFNIHSYKRFTMGGRPGDQSTPETRDLSFTIVPKQKLIENPRGNVLRNALFTHPKDPSQNYYFLLFNDDSGLDLQVNRVNINGIASIAVAS